ncbi:MAG: alkaline phosphatase family protein [Saprospiraceae bacterium]|nr:alkaline phosphatase family protein [Saprospiraceae bacterium]
MKKIALINVVGLSEKHIGEHTPFINSWSEKRNRSLIEPMLPAVTCSVQTTFLTGKTPADHGIVANGWYFREECEVKFWKQSNKLVQAASIWDHARKMDPAFTCANMFWWYNMYSSVDYSVTPRPQYRANGIKVPDCYSNPPDLRDRLQKDLGTFPLFNFWGPNANIKSSKWISDASKKVYEWHRPDLLLVYLPHLDYCLQKYGPDDLRIVKNLNEIDQVVQDLINYLENECVEVNIVSEYGIVPVSNAVHINRILREAGMLAIREENGLELLDAGQSIAFATADHQLAHIYIQDHSKIKMITEMLENTPGIAEVLNEEGKINNGLNHERSGELVAIAEPDCWFTYYYWLDDQKAPDFARMVDIHKKPGYDPVEMFLDPQKKLIVPRIVLKLIGKKLGFRTMLNVIPIDASLVKGSHGQLNVSDEYKPVFISLKNTPRNISAVDIHDLLLEQIFDNGS